ncbi:MAG: alpha/beta hydrolase [Aquihabitans sp.]
MLVLAVTAAGCSSDPKPVAGTSTIDADGVAFNAVIRPPADGAGADVSPLTVLFLHGASYTSRIWADRGILDRVSEAGYRAVAVDLPGAGATAGTDKDPAEVLAGLVEKLGPPGRVVLVSPSASGRYSLALLAARSDVRLAGFVAVAPVGISDFKPQLTADLPALLVWGADDDVIPIAQARSLRSLLPGSELLVIPDGSHAPYDDEPAAFTKALLGFLSGL